MKNSGLDDTFIAEIFDELLSDKKGKTIKSKVKLTYFYAKQTIINQADYSVHIIDHLVTTDNVMAPKKYSALVGLNVTNGSVAFATLLDPDFATKLFNEMNGNRNKKQGVKC